MSPLFRSLLVTGLLLLAACANKEQGQVPSQSSPPADAISVKPAEPPVLAETPAVEGKEVQKAETRQAYDVPAAAAGAELLSGQQDATRAPAPRMKREYAAESYSTPMSVPAAPTSSNPYMPRPVPDREQYGAIVDNAIKQVAESPVSTFSIDVDTGAYANVRRMLNAGRLPPADAVRVEELINYFPYAYPLPRRDSPFAVHTEIAPAPWNKSHHLLRIGIQGQDVAKDSLPPANLVFLVDVSGSMDSPERLPLLKSALKLLIQQLRPQDRVSLVTYASGTQVVLEPTSGAQKGRIAAALDRLVPGGSTYGAGGITLAYRMA